MKYTWTGKSAYGNGKTYLVKGKKMSAVKSVKLPIEYVAEYNCASTTSFADYTAYHFGEEVAYFSDRTDDENLEFNYHPVTQNINIKGYHIPTIYEWYGIEPVGCESTKKTSAKISFGKIEKQSYDSQYTTVKSILYGKRFIGTDYESAYKYSARGYNVVVTVRYLGKKSGVSLSDIANSSWWEENSSEDIVRIFPELGRYETVSKLIHSNKAIYWSSTHAPVTIYYTHPHYYCSYFTSSSVDDDYEISTYENSVPVRLFSDE